MTRDRQVEQAKLYNGAGSLPETVKQMGPVATRLVALSHLRDRLPGGIPAGYTFLAQLLAHEVSAVTPEVSAAMRAGLVVTDRQKGLMLDSIFGPISPMAAETGFFAFRPSASDPGRPISVDVPWVDDKPVVHDDRNADTPILSQLSALFIAYCAKARHLLRARFSEADAAELSRLLTAEVFHQILRNDLLPRILHPDVWALYAGADWRTVDDGGRADGAKIPVEFSNAAFRFGHAMVRSNYMLNDRSPSLSLGDLARGIRGLNERRAANSNFWRVDWRLFFGKGPQVQMGRRIGPGVPPDLETVTALAKRQERDPVASSGKNDIALKDLLRGAGAGLQRVSTIAGALDPFLRARPELGQWALWDGAKRDELMREWLNAGSDVLPDNLLGDPPPYLYTLIEAAAKDRSKGCGEGRTLGALGSVVTAEVVLPPLRHAEKIVVARPDIAAARRMMLGQRKTPQTMLSLIEFLT